MNTTIKQRTCLMKNQKDLEFTKIFDVDKNRSNEDIKLISLENIGHFSIKRSGHKLLNYVEDLSELKYVHVPKFGGFGYDLLDGYTHDWEGEDGNDNDGFLCLIKWVYNNRNSLRSVDKCESGKWLDLDFISNRGILSKIMSTPFDLTTEWRFQATKFKGTIYIHELDSESKILARSMAMHRLSKCWYAGFRFEEYICGDSKYTPPRVNQIDRLNSNQLKVVFKSQLKSHKCLYSAEMDGMKPDGDPGGFDYVEVKTNSCREDIDNFRENKTLKWWTQSHLVGINSVVCGLRDEDFYVREIATFNIDYIRDLGSEFWSPNVCLNFLDSFLNFVKECISKEDETHEFFNNQLKNQIICKKMSSREDLLPNSYRNAFN